MIRAPVLLLALVLAGCGSSAEVRRSNALVDFAGEPPTVSGFVVDRDGTALLGTNRGLFRIPEGSGRAERLQGRVDDPFGSAPVGTGLELDRGPGRTLYGSGHPETAQPLPANLGLLRSRDGGRTWRVLSRLGEADLHRIIALHDRLYAFDAVLGAVLVSRDGGRTWDEHFTPSRDVTDLAVDPADPARLLVTVGDELHTSTDTGDTWSAAPGGGLLAWPAPGVLMRARADGTFAVSADGGGRWEDRARIDGEPAQLVALGADRALVALADGAIVETDDGGRSWEARFEP